MNERHQHSRILEKVAKASLSPEGLQQKGRSRIWLDDHGYWLIVVEFQPSSWARGSYLNVGCMWLFYPQDYLSFDAGHREIDLIEYEDDTQFTKAACSLAATALHKVREYRTEFASLPSIHRHLAEAARPDNIWSLYHVAVAAGLAGDINESAQYFREVERWHCGSQWQEHLQKRAKTCRILLNDLSAFNDQITSFANSTRAVFKLPLISTILEGSHRSQQNG